VYQLPQPVKLADSVEENSDADLEEFPPFPNSTSEIWRPKEKNEFCVLKMGALIPGM
jgi:hypothetical protein